MHRWAATQVQHATGLPSVGCIEIGWSAAVDQHRENCQPPAYAHAVQSLSNTLTPVSAAAHAQHATQVWAMLLHID
jgi:hypothetical protein